MSIIRESAANSRAYPLPYVPGGPDASTTRSLNGDARTLDAADLNRLRDELDGTLLAPDSPGYDDVRAIWNAMVDRRPALIARCHGATDVARSVRFARERELLVAVRGGGHNIAGNAVCDDGLMIDLEP